MIDLYTWFTPNGRKVSLMLEECGLDYTTHAINIGKDDQFAPDFLKISPNNKIPAIVDNDNGKSLMESGAIMMYLADKSGKFWPQDPDDKWSTVEWLMFQMGNVGPMFGQAHHFRGYAKEKLDYPIERYTNEAGRLYRIMDKRLGESPYLGGDTYTIADIATFPWARNPQRRGHDINDLPNLKRWVDEIEARPAVEKALQVLAEHQSKPTDVIDDATRAIMFGDKQFAKR